MADNEKVKVFDPFTKSVIEVTIPTVLVCGTYEDCLMMLILDKDPQKCAKFRGNLANEPELREYLNENKDKITRVTVDPATGKALTDDKLLM